MKEHTGNDVRPFGMRDKIGYMMGDFGNDFTFILSSSYMMKFYTDVMGISGAVVGLAMMVARIVDAFTDVTMGQIVDRSKPRKDGKFRPWIRRMCGPVAVASFLIYQSGFAGMPYGFKVFWMFATYILWGSVFYTSINIPYGSMASAISADPKDRSSLSIWRNIGATLASLVIGTGTPLFAYVIVDGKTVLSGSRMTMIAGAFSIFAVICYLTCYFLVRERVSVSANTEKFELKKLVKSIATNRSLIGIIIAALLLLLSLLSLQGMAGYVFPNYYGSAKAQSTASLCGSLGLLFICAPLATGLASKFGKKELAMAGCSCSVALLIALFIIRPKNPYVYVVFYALAQVGYGFFNTTIWAMITDVIDDAEIKNGIREDGTIYAVYSFARKLGQAASSGLIGSLLSMIGYTAATAYEPEIVNALFNMACLIPAVGLTLVVLSLGFIYPLNRKKVEENAAILKNR